MNGRSLVAAGVIVLGLALIAANAPAAPGVSAYVPPPAQQTTNDNGNTHGDVGVATPNGGPGGGDRCKPPRCRRFNYQEPVPNKHNTDITGGRGPVATETPCAVTPPPLSKRPPMPTT